MSARRDGDIVVVIVASADSFPLLPFVRWVGSIRAVRFVVPVAFCVVPSYHMSDTGPGVARHFW